jgi:hypothetical protein
MHRDPRHCEGDARWDLGDAALIAMHLAKMQAEHVGKLVLVELQNALSAMSELFGCHVALSSSSLT